MVCLALPMSLLFCLGFWTPWEMMKSANELKWRVIWIWLVWAMIWCPFLHRFSNYGQICQHGMHWNILIRHWHKKLSIVWSINDRGNQAILNWAVWLASCSFAWKIKFTIFTITAVRQAVLSDFGLWLCSRASDLPALTGVFRELCSRLIWNWGYQIEISGPQANPYDKRKLVVIRSRLTLQSERITHCRYHWTSYSAWKLKWKTCSYPNLVMTLHVTRPLSQAPSVDNSLELSNQYST